MNEILNWVNSTEWLNILYLVLALLSILVAIIQTRKVEKKKKIYYDVRSINVLSESLKEKGKIQVIYNKSKIEDLTISKILIWNGGNTPIRRDDIANRDPVTIQFTDQYDILNAEFVYKSSIANNFSMDLMDAGIKVDFDFLDPKQGCLIKLAHTGNSSSDVILTGTIIGFGELEYEEIDPDYGNTDESFKEKFINALSYVVAFVLAVIVFKVVQYFVLDPTISFIVCIIILTIFIVLDKMNSHYQKIHDLADKFFDD